MKSWKIPKAEVTPNYKSKILFFNLHQRSKEVQALEKKSIIYAPDFVSRVDVFLGKKVKARQFKT